MTTRPLPTFGHRARATEEAENLVGELNRLRTLNARLRREVSDAQAYIATLEAKLAGERRGAG